MASVAVDEDFQDKGLEYYVTFDADADSEMPERVQLEMSRVEEAFRFFRAGDILAMIQGRIEGGSHINICPLDLSKWYSFGYYNALHVVLKSAYDYIKSDKYPASDDEMDGMLSPETFNRILDSIRHLCIAEKALMMGKTAYDESAIDLVAFSTPRCMKIVQLLMSLGNVFDAEGLIQHLSHAVTCHNYGLAKLLLEAGADPNKTRGGDDSNLHHLCNGREISIRRAKMMRLLLKYGADPLEEVPHSRGSQHPLLYVAAERIFGQQYGHEDDLEIPKCQSNMIILLVNHVKSIDVDWLSRVVPTLSDFFKLYDRMTKAVDSSDVDIMDCQCDMTGCAGCVGVTFLDMLLQNLCPEGVCITAVALE